MNSGIIEEKVKQLGQEVFLLPGQISFRGSFDFVRFRNGQSLVYSPVLMVEDDELPELSKGDMLQVGNRTYGVKRIARLEFDSVVIYLSDVY